MADLQFRQFMEKRTVTVLWACWRGDDVICRQQETEKDGGASSIIRTGRASGTRRTKEGLRQRQKRMRGRGIFGRGQSSVRKSALTTLWRFIFRTWGTMLFGHNHPHFLRLLCCLHLPDLPLIHNQPLLPRP